MICNVYSHLFHSFLSQKGGTSEKRRTEEQKPRIKV
ncbi:Wound-induced basic protein [Bienertia sinuspersici]